MSHDLTTKLQKLHKLLDRLSIQCSTEVCSHSDLLLFMGVVKTHKGLIKS